MTDIIALIDNAVEDWETSPDAMRWAPDRPKPERITHTSARLFWGPSGSVDLSEMATAGTFPIPVVSALDDETTASMPGVQADEMTIEGYFDPPCVPDPLTSVRPGDRLTVDGAAATVITVGPDGVTIELDDPAAWLAQRPAGTSPTT